MFTTKFHTIVFLNLLMSLQFVICKNNCEQKEKSLNSLDVADYLITKAKEILPNCTGIATDSSDCGIKEKVEAHLDMVQKLISEAKENYPTCIEPNTKDPEIKEPVTKEPETEDTVGEDSVGEDSVGEDPVTKRPKTEAPVTEGPVGEVTVTEGPVTEGSVTEDPVTEEPVTKKPVTMKPVTKKPTTKKPVTKKPVTKKPTTKKPTTKKPVTKKPTTKKPTTKKPVTKKPVTKKPVTMKPVTKEPVTEEPVTKKPKECPKCRDCSELLQYGQSVSGVYTIWPSSSLFPNKPLEVFCDMDKYGGGWTVIQRRRHYQPEEDFYRDWNDYKNGFGNINKDFWLGNDNIFILSNQRKYEIRFDIESKEGEKAYALYKTFSIGNEGSGYKLHIGNYAGTAGDSMIHNNGWAFSTKGGNNGCPHIYKGGWWYSNCGGSNLNGDYNSGGYYNNIYWFYWKQTWIGLAASEIKIKAL